MLALKGFCMGTADLIPGISGGTIAFLFGICEELILSLRKVDASFAWLLMKGKVGQALRHVNWRFLVAVLGGDVLAIFSLSKFIRWLLTHYPVLVQSFFFGLIAATVFVIARSIARWELRHFGGMFIAAVLTFYVVGLVPVATPDTWWFLFFSGALAICAMILPGISGAFILVLLGKYQFIIQAVSDRNLAVLGIVFAGIVVGILSFVRILNYLFKHYHNTVVACLTGLVLGSLRKVWPWKQVLEALRTKSGKIIPLREINVMPDLNIWALAAVGLMVAGFFLAYRLGNISQPKRLFQS